MTRLRTLAIKAALRLAPTAVKATLVVGIAAALVVTAPVTLAVLGLAVGNMSRSEP